MKVTNYVKHKRILLSKLAIIKMTINCRGKILDFSIPKVMGILNITPDSFYDGGKYLNEEALIKQVEKMLNDGADIVDVGGMSSRPGAEIISAEEEIKRVLPVVQNIIKNFPEAIVSIDTLHSKTADICLKEGVHIINDITGGRYDEQMLTVVAKHKAPFIIMHMQGLPGTMQQNPTYQNVVNEIMDFFAERIAACKEAGILDLILDSGFGFGKTIEHNYTLLRNHQLFSTFHRPMLAGVSRKGMITKLLDIKASEALNGTTVLNTVALMNGASLLRVHDVKEAKEAVRLFSALTDF